MTAPADPHAPLRDDVRLLGTLLGDTLRAQSGDVLFDTVERVRALAKSARGGSDEDFALLERLLSQLAVDDAVPLARAFSHFLTLANIAEQHHRVRRRRFYAQSETSPPQRASFADSFSTLLQGAVTRDALHQAVCRLRVELVLTAHPTEITRRTLLEKYNRVAHALLLRDRPDLTRDERKDVIESLRREIASIWLTDEIRRQRPTPVDEAEGGLYVLEQTVWDVLPGVLRQLDGALRQATGQGLPLLSAPITFGSWMGGDRDGNPNVTPAVTRRVCLLARAIAARLYQREVDALCAELSMEGCSEALRARVGDVREPYRALLRGVRDRLARTQAHFEALLHDGTPPEGDIYDDAADLADVLLACHQSLTSVGASVIADGRLCDVIRRLACFGLTLVRLDIRQESTRHEEALDAVTRHLGLGSYAQWDEPQRQRFLVAELQSRRPLIPRELPCDERVLDVLDTFVALRAIGGDSLGAYVISMAERPSDVLAVELLQKEAGLEHPLRVVPLFETLDDLQRAGDTVRELLSIPWYRAHIAGRQEVMIGYSDSAKDAGRLTAAWALYKAQESVVAACREHGVTPTLFHGRGGSVGRGGGPTWLAIRSQPPGSVSGALRVTEQGEMIQAKFGLPGIAQRTLELYLTATLHATVDEPKVPSEKWRELMERLSDAAHAVYRDVVKKDPRFVPYFRAATPEEELGTLNIGSRPARRRREGGVESLRAIPWIFAWTQTRHMLPAWLGVGEALQALKQVGATDEVSAMYREWPFFQSTIDLVEMVLAKAEPRIAAQYDRRLVPDELLPLARALLGRLQQTTDAVLRLTGHRRLVEDNAVLRRSIDVRNPYVDPINLLQVEILRRLRRGEQHPQLHDALLMTINGIAAGLRNTG